MKIHQHKHVTMQTTFNPYFTLELWVTQGGWTCETESDTKNEDLEPQEKP